MLMKLFFICLLLLLSYEDLAQANTPEKIGETTTQKGILSLEDINTVRDNVQKSAESYQLLRNITNDSISLSATGESFKIKLDKVTSSRTFQLVYIGAPLIAGGLIVKYGDDHFRSLRNEYIPTFSQHYDDYLQFAPAMAMIGMKLGGVEGRSSWSRMLASDAFSVAIMAAAVNTLKCTTNVMRPDGSNNHSFPSGHTATAFMAATMMHKEYGLTRSPWYSIGAYSLATITGVTRQLNNKHWLSDIMVGAGIGILSTEFGYFLADLLFKDKGLTHSYLEEEEFDRFRNPSFFGLYMGVNLLPGEFSMHNGSSLSLSAGSNAGLEGAWFMNPYLGFGGRFSVASMGVLVDDVAQNDNLDIFTCSVGPYFSYPVSSRWSAGSKLLAGYSRFSKYTLSSSTAEIGKKGGLTIGSGLSMDYLVKQNFGVRFFVDYNLLPSPVPGNCTLKHLLTVGGSMKVQF